MTTTRGANKQTVYAPLDPVSNSDCLLQISLWTVDEALSRLYSLVLLQYLDDWLGGSHVSSGGRKDRGERAAAGYIYSIGRPIMIT